MKLCTLCFTSPAGVLKLARSHGVRVDLVCCFVMNKAKTEYNNTIICHYAGLYNYLPKARKPVIDVHYHRLVARNQGSPVDLQGWYPCTLGGVCMRQAPP